MTFVVQAPRLLLTLAILIVASVCPVVADDCPDGLCRCPGTPFPGYYLCTESCCDEPEPEPTGPSRQTVCKRLCKRRGGLEACEALAAQPDPWQPESSSRAKQCRKLAFQRCVQYRSNCEPVDVTAAMGRRLQAVGAERPPPGHDFVAVLVQFGVGGPSFRLGELLLDLGGQRYAPVSLLGTGECDGSTLKGNCQTFFVVPSSELSLEGRLFYRGTELVGVIVGDSRRARRLRARLSKLVSASADASDLVPIAGEANPPTDFTLTSSIAKVTTFATPDVTGSVTAVLEVDFRYCCTAPVSVTPDDVSLEVVGTLIAPHEPACELRDIIPGSLYECIPPRRPPGGCGLPPGYPCGPPLPLELSRLEKRWTTQCDDRLLGDADRRCRFMFQLPGGMSSGTLHVGTSARRSMAAVTWPSPPERDISGPWMFSFGSNSCRITLNHGTTDAGQSLDGLACGLQFVRGTIEDGGAFELSGYANACPLDTRGHTLSGTVSSDLTSMTGTYACGSEPDAHIPFSAIRE